MRCLIGFDHTLPIMYNVAYNHLRILKEWFFIPYKYIHRKLHVPPTLLKSNGFFGAEGL